MTKRPEVEPICIPFIRLLDAPGRYVAYAGCLAVMVYDALYYFILPHRKLPPGLEEIERTIVVELQKYGDDLQEPQLRLLLPEAPQLRLLLAEDQETNRWLRNVVEDKGRYVVVVGEVSDGKEVLQEAFSLKPDIILMDVQMPSLNGLEAIREIAKNLSNTKVVVLSSTYSPDIERKAIEAGALRYLQKENFDIFEILENIQPHKFFRTTNGSIRLSPQARRIIDLVRRGLSDREIAVDLAISEKTARRLVKIVEESSGH